MCGGGGCSGAAGSHNFGIKLYSYSLIYKYNFVFEFNHL
jgi:hypothetical protein